MPLSKLFLIIKIISHKKTLNPKLYLCSSISTYDATTMTVASDKESTLLWFPLQLIKVKAYAYLGSDQIGKKLVKDHSRLR